MVQFVGYFGNFLKNQNHWVGLAGIIIGAILSAYFYFASKPLGEISLTFKTVKIAQTSRAITLLDAQGNFITSDVFALEVVVWNTGNISLGEKSDRVRRAFFLSLDDKVRILAAEIQETANATPSELNGRSTIDNQTVRIDWSEFDPNDAFKLSVVYSSPSQSNILYGGRFIGTNLTSLSDHKEIYPGQSGLSRLYSRVVFDWENHKAKTITQAMVFLVILVVLFLIPLSLKAKHNRYEMISVSLLFAALALTLAVSQLSSVSPPL